MVLAQAIKEERWELVALCLLMGVIRAAEKLPPEALEGLLDLLGGEDGS